MFKYGEPRKINTFTNLTRNTTFRTSDRITAKVMPEDVLNVLKNNSFDTSAFSSSNINASEFSSDNANIDTLIVDAIGARNDFIKMIDKTLITNRNDLNESQLKSFMNGLNIPYTDSSFTIALDTDDSFNESRNIAIYCYDATFMGNIIDFKNEKMNIGDNFVSLNTNNKNYYGLNFKTNIEGNDYFNSLIYLENLKINDEINLTLSVDDNDEIRFKDDNNYKNTNLRFINIPENVDLSSSVYNNATINFIEDLNNNIYQDEYYLPIECDKIILHNGNIINPNQNKNISLSIFEGLDGTNNNIYRNVINLLNTTIQQRLIVTEFNSPIFLNNYKNSSNTTFNPKIYYNGILYLSNNYDKNNTPSDTVNLDNYVLKIDTELNSTKSLNFELSDATITFEDNISINKSDDKFIELTETVGTTKDQIRLYKETYPDRILFSELHQKNINNTNNIIYGDNIKFNGPNNLAVEYKDSEYNFLDGVDLDGKNQVFSKCTIENKNSIIGRKQILKNLDDTTTKSSNMNYPFDSKDINDIIDNQELKYNTRNYNESDKKDLILTHFNQEISDLDDLKNITKDNNIILNYEEKKREIIKKYFYIEPNEKKFINGVFIEASDKIQTSKNLLSDDFISDLTNNTKRVYYKINPSDVYYNLTDERYKYLNEGFGNNEVLFYKTSIVEGKIYLTDIFNFIDDGGIIEYIFENSFSLNGYVCLKENIHEGSKSAHFKIEGFYDATQQKITITPIFRPDDLWNINMNFEYDKNRIKISILHNSINQIIATASINILIC